jgi:hypothetical protein
MRMWCVARASSAGDTPCPSCPISQAQGCGSSALCSHSPRCELVATSGTCSAVERLGLHAFDQPQAEMRAHAGAQHLRRPQCGRALERDHLGETEGGRAAQDGATLPASCRRSSTTLGASGMQSGRDGRSSTKPMGAGDSSPLTPRSRSSLTTTVFGGIRPFDGRAGPERLRKHRHGGLHARASAARHRWSPSSQTRPSLRYAPGSCASLRRSLSSGLSRELMWLAPVRKSWGVQGAARNVEAHGSDAPIAIAAAQSVAGSTTFRQPPRCAPAPRPPG